MNNDGVMAILLGGGIPNATASIMALGLDERFDLTQSYWLIAGIAGGDPEDLSLGSAAWAKHVVDGDLLYEIDGREIPDDWAYGMIPLGSKRPTTDPDELLGGWTVDTMAFTLNAQLVEWAFSITRDIEIEDGPGITAYRDHYKNYPQAQRPPFVTIGGHHELQHLLAWKIHESVGQRLDETVSRRGRQLHDFQYGRQRYANVFNTLIPGWSSRHGPCTHFAHG